MKRLTVLLLCFIILISAFGCTVSENSSTVFKQQMTIIRMPSPPKCKTTSNITYIDRVLSAFSEAQKTPLDENVNGWHYKIDLVVDGETFTYAVNESVYTDSNGRQYSIDGKDIIKILDEVYEAINDTETDYIKN